MSLAASVAIPPGAVRIARSPPRDSATLIPVGRSPQTITWLVPTPARRSSPSMNCPAASSPIAATSSTLAPSLAAATAVIAAEPPTTSETAGTICSCWPNAGVTSPVSTMTSGLQSPTTTRSAMRPPLLLPWYFAHLMLDYACVGSISRRNVHCVARRGMILAVTLNPALDVTHHVRHADWNGVNRPYRVLTRPGGKGLNVARVLRTLGADVRAIGLAGGLDGQAVLEGLAAAGVPATFTPIAGPTRRTFTVVDEAAGRVAAFNEPGPAVAHGEYRRFRPLFGRALAGCSVAVLSGSVPPGVPATGYAALTKTAAAAGVPVILDADGPALRHALAAGPAVVKPNLAELERAAGRQLRAGGEPDLAAVAAAARELTAAGAGAPVG